MHTLVIGAGFSGLRIAQLACKAGSVTATRRSAESLIALDKAGIRGVVLNEHSQPEELQEALSTVTHLVICAGPARTEPLDDSVLRLFTHEALRLPQLQWVAYLSTIGVYGNHDGNWVNESTPCSSTQVRSRMRREAELGWQARALHWQVPISVLRLSGIYGPGRNAIIDALNGRARMLIKPGQVFNRIHVDDLAAATVKAAELKYNGVLNITDDVPAAPQEVITFAHTLVGKAAPVAVDFDTAEISDMARSFYNENKRVRNSLSKTALQFEYRYPDYKSGLQSVFDHIQQG